MSAAGKSERFDVIVAGLGGMGSAALFHLARRRVKVLGLDQFEPPHSLGSSHGETRVIREAYFEDPVYVPLVQRAYELWSELEKSSGLDLYIKTGGVMIGARNSTVVEGAIRSATEHKLAHEVLTAAEIARRFPGLRPGKDMLGVLEPRAGILFPERCIAAHLEQARRAGARIQLRERLLKFESTGEGVTIATTAGSYRAAKIILAAGPWLSELLSLKEPLSIERQVLLWYEAKDPSLFTLDRFPIHLWEYEPEKMFYGFPDLGTGVKVAFHHQGEITSPADVQRTVLESDIEKMRELLKRFLPAANGKFLRGTVCLYSNARDGHFILDRSASCRDVLVASPCSGHGFKFASAIGEVLADLATDRPPRINLARFCLKRFEAAR